MLLLLLLLVLPLYQFAVIFHRHGMKIERAFEFRIFLFMFDSFRLFPILIHIIPPIASMLLMLFLGTSICFFVFFFYIMPLMLFIVQSLFWYSNFKHFATMNWIFLSFISLPSHQFAASEEDKTENKFIYLYLNLFTHPHSIAFFGPCGNIESQKKKKKN